MDTKNTILVTGGTGYIGSHTVVALIEKGFDVVLIDNLSNSNKNVLDRIEKITKIPIKFYEGDCRDESLLNEIFQKNIINSVIHFAGYKAVGESVANPIKYYENNIGSTLTLCKVMQDNKVTSIIFSSSATVYGTPSKLPIDESSKVGEDITNPYGRSKYMVEEILKDIALSDPVWKVTILRYFNPIGAHKSGLIGESPNGVPNNLLPYIAQVAVGKMDKLKVFGNDYDTKDGTGVRDYIHVMDLAEGHVAAVKFSNPNPNECNIYNLGTGKGNSVMDLIASFELASGKNIPYDVVDRRPGDIAASYADCSKANKELNWKADRSIAESCEDTWRWQSSDFA